MTNLFQYQKILFLLVLLTFATSSVAQSDGPHLFYNGTAVTEKRLSTNQTVTTKEHGSAQGLSIKCTLEEEKISFDVPIRPDHSMTPAIIPAASKILVTSDIEANITGLINYLTKAGAIDASLKWSFGTGTLIIVGDVFDRGLRVTETLWLLYKLQGEAKAAGGNVFVMIGNHELMCLTGDYRYIEPVERQQPAYANKFGVAEYKLLYGNNTELGRWLRTSPTIIKVGNYVFNHAGVSPQLAAKKYSLDQINQFVIDKLNGKTSSDITFVTTTDGCLWYRGYFSSPVATQAQVDAVMTYLGAERIFVGHTKQATLKGNFNNKVFGIDIENNHQGNNFQGILFEGSAAYLFDGVKGTKTLLFGNPVSVENQGKKSSVPAVSIAKNAISLSSTGGMLSIYNLQGVKIETFGISSGTQTVDLSQFASNVYVAQFKTPDHGMIAQKIHIE